MPANYNGDGSAIVASDPVAISCPVDADPPNAASVNTPLQQLADFMDFLRDHALLRDAPLAATLGDRLLVYEAGSVNGMIARIYVCAVGDAYGFELTFNAKWEAGAWHFDRTSGGGGTPMTRLCCYSGLSASGTERLAGFAFDHCDDMVAGAGPISEATFKASRLAWGNTDDRAQWKDVTAFLNGWTNYGSSGGHNAAYRIASNGRSTVVELSGCIKSGVIGSPAFVVPFAPARQVQVPCVSNGAFGAVLIETDGSVTVTVGTNARVYLDGIRWRIS